MKLQKKLLVLFTLSFGLTGCYTQLQYSKGMSRKAEDDRKVDGYSWSQESDSNEKAVQEEADTIYMAETYGAKPDPYREASYADGYGDDYYDSYDGYDSYDASAEEDYIPVYYKDYQTDRRWNDCNCNPYKDYSLSYGYNSYSPYYSSYYSTNPYRHYYSHHYHHSWHHGTSYICPYYATFYSPGYHFGWRWSNYGWGPGHYYAFSIGWGSPYYHSPFHSWYGSWYGHRYTIFYGNYYYHNYYGGKYNYKNYTYRDRNRKQDRRYGTRSIGTNRVDIGNRSRDRGNSTTVRGRYDRSGDYGRSRTIDRGAVRSRDRGAAIDRSRDRGTTGRNRGTVDRNRTRNRSNGNGSDARVDRRRDNRRSLYAPDNRRAIDESRRMERRRADYESILKSRRPQSDYFDRYKSYDRSRKTRSIFGRLDSFFNFGRSKSFSNGSRSNFGNSGVRSRSSSGSSKSRGSVSRGSSRSSSSSGSRSRSGGGSSKKRSRGGN